MANILEIKDLSVSYDGNTVLNHINLNVEQNEIISIVGESGSGKTTLINAITHMLNPNASVISGEIVFDNRSLSCLTNREWQVIRGDEIGVIFQNAKTYLNPIRKIGKQFEDTIRAHRNVTKTMAREMAIKSLENMGFEEPKRILNAYTYQLSGGMSQRVAIAMCLVLEPKILLADEPTSALDVVSQARVIETLKRVRDVFNTTVIMVTHNIGSAAHLSDRIVVMNDGCIEEIGSVEQVIGKPQKAYTKTLLGAVPVLKGHRDESEIN